jgi:SWI/SNF-related matrix-associated actin-dependent regulator 1 of chromatin subfamily A
MRIKTKPLPHQIEGVELIDKFQGDALIADEMGLGKSFTSLLWAVKNEQWPIVIICPAALKYNWQNEIKQHFGARSLVLEGRDTSEQKHLIPVNKFIILNFQILEAWLPILRKLRPTTLILDECQAISNRTSQAYHNFARIRRRSHNLLALSGTPLTNRAAELWPVLNFLRPDKFPSFWTYAVEHCEPRKGTNGKMEYQGSRKLDVLHRKAKKYCMIRRLKKDVLQLPPKVREVIALPITAGSEYMQAERDFKRWYRQNKGLSALVKASKSMSMVKTNHYRQLCVEAKMDSILKWVENFLEESDGKLVLMFSHTAPIHIVMKKFGKRAIKINGEITGRKRQDAVDRFKKDPRCRLAVCNTVAAGVGLTLTVAHHLAFCEFPWTPGAVKQAEDRIHRMTQEETSFIYYLVAKGSVEEKIAKLIAKKDDTLNAVLDDGKNERWQVDRLIKKAK